MLNWHFNIYEHDKFHAQLSLLECSFYNLGTGMKEKLGIDSGD